MLLVGLSTAWTPPLAITETDWPEAAYNPSPLPGDLVLPMPCGGAMVFRRVPTGPGGALDELMVELGNDDPELGFAERRHRTGVAGPFRDPEGRHLLVGKYEVNGLQYRSLFSRFSDRTCPRAANTPTPARVHLSWHEAVGFAHRYSLWLARNADRIPTCGPDPASDIRQSRERDPDLPCIPKQDGIPAFLRLPTEAEWEFAARGGADVSPSGLQATGYPMPEGLDRYAWFNANSDGEIKPIGLRRPNPLGLFDMLGNAEEMVLEPFRLRLPGRLHGQAGGFVVRGGSIRSDRGEIRTSLRREVPYYDRGGPTRTPDTGFRLLASLPVFTSAERLMQIRAAWQQLIRQETRNDSLAKPVPAAESGPGGTAPRPLAMDALDALTALIREAESPGVKQRLERLRDLVVAERTKLREQRLLAAREGLRLGGLTCSKLHDESHNLNLLRATLRVCVENRGKDFPRCVQRARQLDRDEQVLRENARFHADTVLRTADAYGEDPGVLDRAFDDLAASLARRGYPDLKLYPHRFLEQVRGYRGGDEPRADAWLDECRELP